MTIWLPIIGPSSSGSGRKRLKQIGFVYPIAAAISLHGFCFEPHFVSNVYTIGDIIDVLLFSGFQIPKNSKKINNIKSVMNIIILIR